MRTMLYIFRSKLNSNYPRFAIRSAIQHYLAILELTNLYLHYDNHVKRVITKRRDLKSQYL